MLIKIHQRINFICSCVLLLLLSACSTGIYHEGGDEYGYWSLDGKLGIRSSSGAESVALLWQQCGNRYQIRLNSLIGTHIASIDGNPSSVTAQFNDRPALQAESAEALIQSELGWTLPVGALQYWLRGEVDPQLSQNIQRNADGSLKQLTQDDWQIDYLRYHSQDSSQNTLQKNSRKLPEKIRLKRADTTLTLIISNWRLGIAPEHCLDN